MKKRKVDFRKVQDQASANRQSTYDGLRNARAIQRESRKTLDREFKKNPIEYGEDGEMLTHPGIPVGEIQREISAQEKRESAGKKFRKYRGIQKNIGVLKGVNIGDKVEFESQRGNRYKGKVTGINVSGGIVYLKKGFFSKPTPLRIDRLKRRV